MKEYNEQLNEVGKWLSVDADNVFKFAGSYFRIPYNNRDYRVTDSYRDDYNYSNISSMDSVFAVTEQDGDCFRIKFYNEKNEPLKFVRMLRGDYVDK